jgi:hypothetical protein
VRVLSEGPSVDAVKTRRADGERRKLYAAYEPLIEVNGDLSRALVSFQGNKKEPFYRWFKYKEGFSSRLVTYYLQSTDIPRGMLLDPFAGAGTALFAARGFGWDAAGVELHPVPLFAIETRLAAEELSVEELERAIERIECKEYAACAASFPHLRITAGAFPAGNEKQLMAYWSYCGNRVRDPKVQRILKFAALCVLEEISYTRKDGQYLRWDARSPKKNGKGSFRKGRIAEFHEAIMRKLRMMRSDLSELVGDGQLFGTPTRRGGLDLREGSCLHVLPEMASECADLVVTSPPYCNRYDYTRTYALELALLGRDEAAVKRLRQALLSCTVENRAKRDELRALYEDRDDRQTFDHAEGCFDSVDALHEVLAILDDIGRSGQLNNANLPRMVRNYFYEMSFVVAELFRIMKHGGKVVMVNDNVRYAGEEVPVDLILCELGRLMGFETERIWVLSRGKGNSSQQMGAHGRQELRKCVYAWEKP